jgi:hypothetical protein
MKSRIGPPSLGRTTSLHARRRRSRKARSPAASSSPWLAAVRVNGSSWGSSWPGAFRWDGNNRHNRLAIDPLHGQPPSARPQSRLGQLPVQDQTRATAGTAATRSAAPSARPQSRRGQLAVQHQLEPRPAQPPPDPPGSHLRAAPQPSPRHHVRDPAHRRRQTQSAPRPPLATSGAELLVGRNARQERPVAGPQLAQGLAMGSRRWWSGGEAG